MRYVLLPLVSGMQTVIFTATTDLRSKRWGWHRLKHHTFYSSLIKNSHFSYLTCCYRPFANFQNYKKVDSDIFAHFSFPLWGGGEIWSILLCYFHWYHLRSFLTPIVASQGLNTTWVTNTSFRSFWDLTDQKVQFCVQKSVLYWISIFQHLEKSKFMVAVQ